jgi:hypothetical protein
MPRRTPFPLGNRLVGEHRRDRFGSARGGARATGASSRSKRAPRAAGPTGACGVRSLAYGRRGPRGNANGGRGLRRSRLRCDPRSTSEPPPCSCNDEPHKPSRCLSPPSEASHGLFGPSLRSKPITPADLPREPRVQGFSGFGVAGVDIEPSTAACTYPAPLPDKRALAEHSLLDGEHVVPSHVQAIVPTVQHQDLKAIVEG